MPAFIIYHLDRYTARPPASGSGLAQRISMLWPGNRLQFKGMWIVEAQTTSDQIRDSLKPHMPPEDGLLVIAMGPDAAWSGVDTGVGDWLLDRLT